MSVGLTTFDTQIDLYEFDNTYERDEAAGKCKPHPIMFHWHMRVHRELGL
jgi:hypothetical protein